MAPLSQAQRTSSGEPHSNNHTQARQKLEIILDYVSLGRSGMKVSRYILGTLTFAGTNGLEALGDVNVANARRMIDTARDAGINAFDTANLYSKGDAETVLGEAIKGRRGDLLLFSKGRSAAPGGTDRGRRATRPLHPFWHRAMWGMDRPTPAERLYLEGHRQAVGM
jgi:hypothetical protein